MEKRRLGRTDMNVTVLVCGGAAVAGVFFSSRRRHTRLQGDWSSDVCSSDLDERGDRRRRAWSEQLAQHRAGGVEIGGGRERRAGFGLWTSVPGASGAGLGALDRKSTRLNSSHLVISYAVFCLEKKITMKHVK